MDTQKDMARTAYINRKLYCIGSYNNDDYQDSNYYMSLRSYNIDSKSFILYGEICIKADGSISAYNFNDNIMDIATYIEDLNYHIDPIKNILLNDFIEWNVEWRKLFFDPELQHLQYDYDENKSLARDSYIEQKLFCFGFLKGHDNYRIIIRSQYGPQHDLGKIKMRGDSVISIHNFNECLSSIANYIERVVRYLPNPKVTLLQELIIWNSEWREKEIIENKLGIIEQLSTTINFYELYNKSDKKKIDYFANILRLVVFGMRQLESKKEEFNSIASFYDGPDPCDDVVLSFHQIGIRKTISVNGIETWIMTPFGPIKIEHAIFALLRPGPYLDETSDTFYFSIMKNIDGSNLEEIYITYSRISIENIWRFWNANRDLIFFRAMILNSIKPINTKNAINDKIIIRPSFVTVKQSNNVDQFFYNKRKIEGK